MSNTTAPPALSITALASRVPQCARLAYNYTSPSGPVYFNILDASGRQLLERGNWMTSTARGE
ncbi:hypothetical protein Q8F55_001289 [Vanrija albida]|uniref:Uncharacterized protein n=1 Tax=Vanrija albida TaxID=181172 RepID=A0ABR3QFK3_9TREE